MGGMKPPFCKQGGSIMIVQHNIMALSSYRQNTLANIKLASSLEKLASGYRINRAADDPAGLAVSEKMRAQQTGVSRAMANAQDAQNLVNTAEGALTEVHSMLNRLTDLAGQAANGTLQDSQRQSIQKEASDILAEIGRISKATNHNGINLLDGSLSGNGSAAEVSGLKVSETAPTAGSYEFAAMPDLNGLAAGDSVSFTLSTNDGNSRTVSFTVNDDLSGMVGTDGTNYTFSTQPGAGDTNVNVAGSDVASAVADQLGRTTTISNSFILDDSGASLSLQNRETGSAAPRVTGLSYSVNGTGRTQVAGTGTTGTDTVRTLNREAFTVFDGTNESQAVFKVNGEKFALVSSMDYEATIAKLGDRDVNIIQVDATSGAALTDSELQGVAANINQKTNLALEANGSGGITLKSPTGGAGLTFQVGDTADAFNRITLAIGDMSARGLGLESISFDTQEAASAALTRINSAIETVSATRGNLGALSNRLTTTVRNLDTTYENITAAESRIRDTDMAKTMMEFTKQSLLSQVSQAMMAQANMQSQQVLQLLR